MILTCPSCQSRYAVPDSAIGVSGRKVRCAGCRHSWFQAPPGAPATAPAPRLPAGLAARAAPPTEPAAPPASHALPPEREPEPEPDQGQDAYYRPRRNRARLWTVIAVIAALLMTGAAVAIQYFGLPAFGQSFGIPVQSAGALGIVDEAAQTRRLERGNEVLEVSGTIVNQTDEVQRVPQIRAELKDTQGRVVYSWSIAPPVSELQPRGRVPFNNASVGIPSGGRMLSLTFGPVS